MDNSEIKLMDALNLMSLFIGLSNLDANLTQNDKQELIEDMHSSLEKMVADVHNHLERQDKKINEMYKMISEMYKNQRG